MMKYFDATTSDKSILKKDILRELVYRQAEEMLVGKNAVVMRNVPVLDLKFDIPKSTRLTPEQIAEGAAAGWQRLEFYQIYSTLDKYQTRVLITDEAKARQVQNAQVEMSIQAAANGLAYQIDSDIFTVLKAGAGLSQVPIAQWSAATADPASDIANAIGQILDKTTIMDTDISKIGVFYPAKLFGHLAKPITIGEVQQTLKNWATREYQINFWPTRMLTTQALLVLKSDETAMHFTYGGGDVPLSEEVRHPGVGIEYLITRYFKTKVIGDSSSTATCSRIATIPGVTS